MYRGLLLRRREVREQVQEESGHQVGRSLQVLDRLGFQHGLLQGHPRA